MMVFQVTKFMAKLVKQCTSREMTVIEMHKILTGTIESLLILTSNNIVF